MTIKRTILALALAGSLALALPAAARGARAPPPRLKWSFAGPFGKYDEAQLQRGFKIYKRGLLELPLDAACCRSAISPSRRPRLLRGAGRGDRGRIQDQGPRRQGRADRARRPAGRPFPAAVPERAGREGRATASRRPTCRRSPRRAAMSAASPGSCSTCSRSIRSRGRTTSPRYLNGYKDAAEGLQAAAGRPLQQIFPRPHHRDAAAAAGRAGRLRRRLAADASTSIPRTSRPS